MSDVIEVMVKASLQSLCENDAAMPEAMRAALRAAEKAGWRLVPVEHVLGSIRNRADSEYCGMISQAEKKECLGWEAKAKSGEFRKAELDAHTRCGEKLGRHLGLCEAARIIQSAPRPWSEDD